VKKRYYILVLFLMFIFSGCGQGDGNKKNISDTTKTPKEDTKKIAERFSIIGVGDIMPGSNYPGDGSLPPDDGKYIFDGVSDYLQDAEVTCGNLEGTLLDRGGTPKKCRDSSGNCHSFRIPTRYAGYMADAGFDFLNLANNHSGDMGIEGRESTYETLEKFEIEYAGTIEHPTAVMEKDGVKYGFAGFAPNTGTVSILNLDKAAEIVEDLKKKSDIVIVFFHGGAEGLSAQRVTGKDETYLGEKRGNVVEFAHTVIDAGADVVFGSGPHVTRAMELYKGRIIAYSLGNFCTYGKFGLNGQMGIAPILKVYVNRKGEFLEGDIIPVKQVRRGFPVFDESNAIIKTMINLTEKDFPETGLEISGEGKITKK
jgi:poly-gamma-glutamate capsule biosynthesis protein CapA/YwtB (metallophosphatase superfamily)